MKHINTQRGRNSELLNGKAGGARVTSVLSKIKYAGLFHERNIQENR
jgi:hypothetical protein